jgi:hypothetical protein
LGPGTISSLQIVIHLAVMDQKENNKDEGIKDIKVKPEGVHIQEHEGNDADAKHNDK